jgi:hypothetical protein
MAMLFAVTPCTPAVARKVATAKFQVCASGE